MQKITPFLWFDDKAEEAVMFYTSVFKDSRISNVARYSKDAPGKEGTLMTASFTLFGQEFTALNGGPIYKFNPAISFVISCEDQAEVDYYWTRLSEGGEEVQCGWLTDKFGISWQVVPKILGELLSSNDKDKVYRVTQAMLKMIKLDIAGLQKAANSDI